MPTSPLVKKVIGQNELVHKKFSLSSNYLKFQLIVSVLATAFIFALLIFIIDYFQNNWQTLLPSNISLQYSNSNFDFGPWWWMLIGIYSVFVIPAFIFYNLFYLKVSNEYIFTNQRVIVRRGWLTTKTTSVHYNRITDVSITQSLADRILKIGALSISTAGQDGYHLVLSHISRPHEIKKELFDQKERYLLNLHQQSVANLGDST